MNILPTTLDGVLLVDTKRHLDQRGAFYRAFCREELALIIGQRQIVQINVSQTRASGAVRGMHYQYPPYAEMKLVRCLKGKIWDVAVDLRAGSSTFLKWHAEELSSENSRMIVIPEGFAHGFQVMAPDSELLYLHTAQYITQSEDGIPYNDARLSIAWPLPVTEVSERDCHHSFLEATYTGIIL